MPSAWLKAMWASDTVGATSRNSARGRSFISSVVTISAAAYDVFELFFGASRKISRIIRSRAMGSNEPCSAPTSSRNQSAPASASAGVPITSGRRSLLKIATARLAWARLTWGRSGSSDRPVRMRSRQSGTASDQGSMSARISQMLRPPAAFSRCRQHDTSHGGTAAEQDSAGAPSAASHRARGKLE